jgi:hypothetical protein
MTKLKIWPMAVGIFVDVFGTLVVAVLYMSIVFGARFADGQVTEDMLTPAHQAIGAALGLLLSVLGGFVAGRLAKIDEVNHGAATGFGSLMLSLLLAWSAPADAHSWRDALVSLAVVPAAALGGYIAARLNARGARQSVKEMQ